MDTLELSRLIKENITKSKNAQDEEANGIVQNMFLERLAKGRDAFDSFGANQIREGLMDAVINKLNTLGFKTETEHLTYGIRVYVILAKQ